MTATEDERSRRAEVFTKIWASNTWGSEESRSGPGSGQARTTIFRAALETFLERVQPPLLYDAPCGDYQWMRLVRLPAGTRYLGADIVPPLIEEVRGRFATCGVNFVLSDIVSDPPPAADVWLCREALFHLTLAEGVAVVEHWRRSRIRWFLATTTPTVENNMEVATGGWRKLNLEIGPFDLGSPQIRLPDAAPADPAKIVGAWRLG